LDESRTDDIPQVSQEENSLLTAPYTEDELHKAVFQMEHNKASSPGGFQGKFYQSSWDVVKPDLLAFIW
jgi:hypothetical protein